MNKRENSKTSFRFFALKLKWPVSYLNDVIKDRKKLTIKRTLELGIFLKLDAVDMERLVFLSLQQSEDKKTYEFFSEKLKEELDSTSYFKTAKVPEPYPEKFHIVDENVYGDISLLALFDIIHWSDGKIKLEQIPNYLYTFPELQDPKILLAKIQTLTELKLIEPIKIKDKITEFKYLKKQLFFNINNKTSHHMAQYAQNYARMVCSSDAKAWIGSGFVMISQDNILEVKKRIMHLRNWMLSIDARANDKLPNEKLLFQFDLNLFSIIRDKNILPKTLTHWGESLQKY